MGRSDGLLSAQETADMLDVNVRHVRHLARIGTLIPVYPNGPSSLPYFRPEEVAALVEVRQKRLDVPTVANLATQSHVLSRSVAARLDELCRFLGLNYERLPMDEEGVVSLFLRARDLVEADDDFSNSEVREWASKFNAIDENYLRLVTEFTAADEPWRPFYELAQKMLLRAPADKLGIDRETSISYALLDSSLKNLRAVCFLYLRQSRGQDAAHEAFDLNDFDNAVISHLFPISPDS